MIKLPIGEVFEIIIDWINDNLGWLLDAIAYVIEITVESLQGGLLWFPPIVLLLIISALAWWLSGTGVGIFSVIGLFVIYSMGHWEPFIITLAMIVIACFVSLGVGIPVGILAAKNDFVNSIIRPLLDFMQTLPPFVYLIPAVIFFSLGIVPGVIATIIFSMPPAIRLTNLGIRQVDEEVIEASQAFGATSGQMLFKVQLPLAIPTIMAGVNQNIMLALSMVVIASMIGAGGLGGIVLRGIQQLQLGLGFEGGLSVVIMAILLDRITQSLQEV